MKKETSKFQRTVPLSIIILTLCYCICACHSTNTKDTMLYTDDAAESIALPGWPAKPERDPNVTSFEKWLHKESSLKNSDIANLVCFIRLRTLKGHPACYLVLSEISERNPSLLGDKLVLGNLWVWPMMASDITKDDLFALIEKDFKNFSKKCQAPDCIFYAAKKVVVGYRNDDYKELSIK